MTKLVVLELIEAMAMTTFYFCFSITAAIPLCVNIALTATIPTAADIDLSEIHNTKGRKRNLPNSSTKGEILAFDDRSVPVFSRGSTSSDVHVSG